MQPKDSERFPKTYGDFAIQSSDAVICYFPRHLLMYMSPVFKDMIEITTYSKPPIPRDGSPVKVTEPCTILEEFLSHLDPKCINHTINQETIQGVLEASRKYQVPEIIRWFEAEVLTSRSGPLASNQATREADISLQRLHQRTYPVKKAASQTCYPCLWGQSCRGNSKEALHGMCIESCKMGTRVERQNN
ncbi:hypothetical protein CPB86DRAFT_729615 [Serendipita vermifera]|nr:hypothetical protein CPB86DRAFT_729615 [Serendipita vermifera]